MHMYLGITIARDRDARKRTLSQQKMTKGLVATYGLADAKPGGANQHRTKLAMGASRWTGTSAHTAGSQEPAVSHQLHKA
jgi:hypothetical protein